MGKVKFGWGYLWFAGRMLGLIVSVYRQYQTHGSQGLGAEWNGGDGN